MFTFTITPDGGKPFQVKAGSRDIYMWEKTHQNKSAYQLATAPSMVDLYAVAHIAARRLQLFAGDIKEFVATCELDTEEDEADEATPFDQDPSAGTSSPSPSSPASRRASGPKKATKR